MNSNPFRIGTILAVALALATGAGAAPSSPKAGVYQYVLHKAQGTPSEIAAAIAEAAPAAGFEVLGLVPVGSPEGCGYSAQVVALYQPEYAKKVVAANRRTGPFGIVDRVNVFEDENGVHVSVVNPRSILRTVLMDDKTHSALVEQHLADLRQLVIGAVEGETSEQDYGQMRKKGHIGRTMGVMAGGPFDRKVQEVSVVGGDDWKEAADRVENGPEAEGAEVGAEPRLRPRAPGSRARRLRHDRDPHGHEVVRNRESGLGRVPAASSCAPGSPTPAPTRSRSWSPKRAPPSTRGRSTPCTA